MPPSGKYMHKTKLLFFLPTEEEAQKGNQNIRRTKTRNPKEKEVNVWMEKMNENSILK